MWVVHKGWPYIPGTETAQSQPSCLESGAYSSIYTEWVRPWSMKTVHIDPLHFTELSKDPRKSFIFELESRTSLTWNRQALAASLLPSGVPAIRSIQSSFWLRQLHFCLLGTPEWFQNSVSLSFHSLKARWSSLLPPGCPSYPSTPQTRSLLANSCSTRNMAGIHSAAPNHPLPVG